MTCGKDGSLVCFQVTEAEVLFEKCYLCLKPALQHGMGGGRWPVGRVAGGWGRRGGQVVVEVLYDRKMLCFTKGLITGFLLNKVSYIFKGDLIYRKLFRTQLLGRASCLH